VQAGNRSRLILNLQQATGYETKIEGNSLLVFLKPVQSDRVSRSSDVRNEEVSAPVTTLVKDIDFRKSDGPAGKLMVMLANSQAGVDIRQQGQSLVVEFAGASLPEGLRRRLDVSDFGTPVQTILAAQVGNKVRLIVTPKGNWEHSAYQSDNQFVLEVREIKVDPSKLTQGPGYSGEKLSLNFQNIEVRSLLQVIADFTSFNIVTSESVSGSLTLRLKDVPFYGTLEKIRIRSCRATDPSLPGFNEEQLLEITRDGEVKLTQKAPSGTEKNKIHIDADLLMNTSNGYETSVKMGERIGIIE
jgi:type IV pilus assembly protein PilQ